MKYDHEHKSGKGLKKSEGSLSDEEMKQGFKSLGKISSELPRFRKGNKNWNRARG
jgi:hypothetical protein